MQQLSLTIKIQSIGYCILYFFPISLSSFKYLLQCQVKLNSPSFVFPMTRYTFQCDLFLRNDNHYHYRDYRSVYCYPYLFSIHSCTIDTGLFYLLRVHGISISNIWLFQRCNVDEWECQWTPLLFQISRDRTRNRIHQFDSTVRMHWVNIYNTAHPRVIKI